MMKCLIPILSLLLSLSAFSQKDSNQDVPVPVAEKSAEYPGGWGEFYKDLSSNIDYAKLDTFGTVYVQLIIDSTGQIIDPVILKGLSETCDREVLNAVKHLKKMKPAEQNGQAVVQPYVLPIRFEPGRR